MRLGLLCALLASVSAVRSAETPATGLVLTATRTVDLSSQIVKTTVEYEVKNGGASSVSSFLHGLSADDDAKLAWIQANAEKKDGKKLKLTKVQVSGAPAGLAFYRVELLAPLAAGQSVQVVVRSQVTQALKPHPAKISQAENQFVRYSGSALVEAAYLVEKQTTTLKYGTGKLVDFTKAEQVKQSSGAVTYGPYNKVPAFSSNPVVLHYENNSPFLVVTRLERWIEISHWGNIAIEEKISVEHRGAQLEGEFSRLDYQMDRRGAKQPVVKSFKTHLPISARDIYYRDQIGNISTSTVTKKANRVELELKPRFPLFGGWKTDYVVGYSVPSVSFLHNKGSDYALKIPFIDHVFENAVVEEAEVKVVLPEGSSNIKLITPFEVSRRKDEVHKTYLDTVGRPVLVLEKRNLVESHSQPITVYYEFERYLLLREPLIAVAAFFAVFLSVVVCSRCDFSIKQAAHQKKD